MKRIAFIIVLAGTVFYSCTKESLDDVEKIKTKIQDNSSSNLSNGPCPVGKWKIGACGTPKGEAYFEFDSNGKTARFKMIDCNKVCIDPLTFTFTYTMSGTTCNFTYDAKQPSVRCTGFSDYIPPTPNPPSNSMTLTCSGNTLTVKGTDVYTRVN